MQTNAFLPLALPAVLSPGQEVVFSETASFSFNRYALSVQTPWPLSGLLTYEKAGMPCTEEFFLPAGNTSFASFVDGILSGASAECPCSISFIPLPKGKEVFGEITLTSLGFTKAECPPERVFLDNGMIKVGASLRFGGGLDYLEALTGDVAAVYRNGRVEVAPGLAEGCPNHCIVTKNVNLLNCHDTGRLVQQSYYGTIEPPYEKGEFMGLDWCYNPVMGGDKSNTPSKIVDFSLTEGEFPTLYVKCRPQDWGHANRPTPSYMEAWYTLDGSCLRVSNRFTDFSGYSHPEKGQELPAFYAIEPLDRLYHMGGELRYHDDLPFWHQRNTRFDSTENWWAWTNKEEDGFGVGLLVPEAEYAIGGIYRHKAPLESLPAESDPTVYVAPIGKVKLLPYKPFCYSYLVCVGRLSEIRRQFAIKRESLQNSCYNTEFQ
jgi:hypothetical protein